MRYEDRRLQQVIFPFTLNQQMRNVLMARFIDIETDFEKERNVAYPSNGYDGSKYESMDVANVPAEVIAAITRLGVVEAEAQTLRETIRSAGYNGTAVLNNILRERSAEEIRAIQKAKEAKFTAASEKHDSRLKALREVARKLQTQVVAAVRVKLDASVLADLDAI